MARKDKKLIKKLIYMQTNKGTRNPITFIFLKNTRSGIDIEDKAQKAQDHHKLFKEIKASNQG